MSRTQRLFDLIQILRSHRYPVTSAVLANDLNISVRTLYRDIATLQEQGANIEGEPGLGYVLRPGFMLPPLMFSEEEIEALVLGSRWVAKHGDKMLSSAAHNALVKIASVLPNDLRVSLDTSSLIVALNNTVASELIDLSIIRRAIRNERKVNIHYRDVKNESSVRTIWPFALGYFDHVRVISAWCELRQSYRHFRVDRILNVEVSDDRYPRRRQVLLKEWRELEGLPLS